MTRKMTPQRLLKRWGATLRGWAVRIPGKTWRERLGQILGVWQGLLFIIGGLAMMTFVKDVPTLIKDTGINDIVAYAWACLYFASGIGYAVAALIRFLWPAWAFFFAYGSLIGLFASVAVYGVGAAASFGILTGIITVGISNAACCFYVVQWSKLQEHYQHMKQGKVIEGGAHQDLS